METMTARTSRISVTRALPPDFVEEDELYSFPKRRRRAEYEYVENSAPLENEEDGSGRRRRARHDFAYEGCDDDHTAAVEAKAHARKSKSSDEAISGKKRRLETSPSDNEGKLNDSIDIERDLSLDEFSDLTLQKLKTHGKYSGNGQENDDAMHDEEMMQYTGNMGEHENDEESELKHDLKYEESNALLRELRVERELIRGRAEAASARGMCKAFSSPAASVVSMSSMTSMETEQYQDNQDTPNSATTKKLNLMQFQQKHARLYEQVSAYKIYL